MQARRVPAKSDPMRVRLRAYTLSALAVALSVACGGAQPRAETSPGAITPSVSGTPPGRASARPTSAEADVFVQMVNAELKDLWSDAERINWVKATYITDDTEKLAAEAQERVMEYLTRRIHGARRFDGLELQPDTARSLYLLKYAAGLPAPADPRERAELAEIASKMESLYGKGKYCSTKLKGRGKDKTSECLDLGELSDLLASSRDYDLLLEAWRGWRTVSVSMRPLYARFVELGNKGARELGFRDMGEIWTGHYDMSSGDFVREMERLYAEVKPLYEDLHCFVRARLRKKYGADKIGPKAPIPAH